MEADMKKTFLKFLLILTFFPVAPHLLAENTPALSVQLQENGYICVYDHQKQIANLMPQIFLKDWKLAFFYAPGRKDKCDAVAKLPDGSRVTYKVSIKAGSSTLKIHAVMVPLQDVHVVDARQTVFFPYGDWQGDNYIIDSQTATIPQSIVYSSGGVIGHTDSTISLGPSHQGGLTVELKGKKLHSSLQDVRQWTPNLSVFYTSRGPGVDELVWKAGEKKVFDCTLTFNRKVAIKPMTPPKSIESIKPQIDALMKPVLDGGWCPGMAVGILFHGKTYVWGYGKTALPDGSTPDGDTEYEIGSITKLFTKLLLSDMVHRNLMGLDDKAQEYLPADVQLPTKDGKEITLLTLSNHTSGLPRDPATWDISKGSSYSSYTLKDLYDYLSHCQLQSVPGEKFSYSNIGVALLGDLVAQKNGTAWEDYVQKRILDPVGMKDTGVRWTPTETARMAQGYDGDGEMVEAWDWQQSPVMPAGSLHSTVNDLMKLGKAALNPKSPLADIAFDDKAEKLDWGKTVSHDGGTYGFNTSFTVNRDKKTVVVVLGNMGSGIVSQTAWQIRSLLEGRLSEGVTFPEITELPPAQLAPYVGKYKITKMPDWWGPIPTGDLVFSVKDGKFYGRFEGGHGWFTDFQIYPLTNGDFYVKKEQFELVFVKDAQGKVTGYTAKDTPAFFSEKEDYVKPAQETDGIPMPPSTAGK